MARSCPAAAKSEEHSVTSRANAWTSTEPQRTTQPQPATVLVRIDVRRKVRRGSPKLMLRKSTSGDPHAGFSPAASDYPKRWGGVAPSRSEDPRYRSAEKA